MSEKLFRLALVGNPNCGKTTIFNQLTGNHQHVGNYSGVTVERISGFCRLPDGREVEIIDLPGVYSLSSGSPEERVAFGELVSGGIDLILNVIDAGNAQRNLYLSTQLAELDIPLLLVFNMIDDAQARGLHFDLPKLESFIGAPIVCTAGSSGRGIPELLEKLQKCIDDPAPRLPVKPKYGPRTDQAIRTLCEAIDKVKGPELDHIPTRCLAIKLLEEDPAFRSRPEFLPLHDEVVRWRAAITARNGLGSDALMADFRYGVIAGACREAITVDNDGRRRLSNTIDMIVTNRFLGIPIFLLMMYLVFTFTFTIGNYPMMVLEAVFNALANAVNALWPAGEADFLRRLIVDGAIGGVGGVLVFLPNIILLFIAIAFLEGTGYMARAAFVMDGFMHIFGLHGKSFIPMLLGMGCSVPAVMATRTIESERDRLTTMLVLPFMSCGARLPIYALFVPAFFAFRYQALVTTLMYVIGTVVALIAARVLKSTLFSGDEEVFVMELPPYRMPTMQSILIQMWERTVMYLHKAGTLILGASIIMFLLNSFPVKGTLSADYDAQLAAIEKSGMTQELKEKESSRLRAMKQAEQLEYSIAGRIGKGIYMVTRPLGFDWRASSALVGAVAGKELFVAQLGVLYSIEDTESGAADLQQLLRENYTPLQGFCIMLFCLLSMPCLATVAVVRRESNSWKWPLFQVVLFTGTAYVITLLVYQIGSHWAA